MQNDFNSFYWFIIEIKWKTFHFKSIPKKYFVVSRQ